MLYYVKREAIFLEEGGRMQGGRREWWREGPGIGYSGAMIEAISQPESIPAAIGSPVVSVTGLTKRFGERLAVDNISCAHPASVRLPPKK